MKKLIEFLSTDLAKVLSVLLILLLIQPLAMAQTPVEQSFTIGLTASSASTNYTSGIQNPAFSSFKPLLLDIRLAATNATVTLKRSATGPAYWSYAMGTDSNTVQFITNDFYFLRGDTIVVGIGVTNISGVIKLQGLEQ
jgi:hypothetical protein